MNRHHVVMISSDYLPNIGGIASHIYYLSKHLIKLGLAVSVVRPMSIDATNGAADLQNVAQEHADVPVFVAPYRESRNKLKRVVSRTSATIRAIKQASSVSFKPYIVHQHDYLTSLPASFLRSFTAKWVWTNHTSQFLGDLASPKKRMKVRLVHSRVNGIISVSREIHEATKELWPQKIAQYIPNGVDTTIFHPDVQGDRRKWGLQYDDFVILCPRRMVEKNGVIYLAQAVSSIVSSLPNVSVKFLFLGNIKASNTDEVYIYSVIETLRPYINKNVVLLGNIPPSLMPEVIALADVVVMPSLVEAVSLSALEAMAMRKPVIATNVGGLPEIVHPWQTGLLVPSKSPEALAKAIMTLYEDRALRVKIGESALELARKQYSWQTIAEQTLDFYESML